MPIVRRLVAVLAVLLLGAGAPLVVTAGAQGGDWGAIDTPRARYGLWGTAAVGLTKHTFACGDCSDGYYWNEDVGTSLTLAGGVRVRRILVGALHRQWQGWFDDPAGRGTTVAGLVGVVLADDGIIAFAPYVGIGGARFRPNESSRAAFDRPVLVGGLGLTIIPFSRVSLLLSMDGQRWLPSRHQGEREPGRAAARSVNIGVNLR